MINVPVSVFSKWWRLEKGGGEIEEEVRVSIHDIKGLSKLKELV